MYQSIHDSSTHSSTLLKYVILSSKYNFAASLLAGESGFGSFNRERIDVSIAHTS